VDRVAGVGHPCRDDFGRIDLRWPINDPPALDPVLKPRSLRHTGILSAIGGLCDGSSRLHGSFPGVQDRHERLLRDVNHADGLHALLAFLLLLQQLVRDSLGPPGPRVSRTGDVTAVAFGRDVLAEGSDGLPLTQPYRVKGLAGDDFVAEGGLERDFEHVAGDLFLQPRDQPAAASLPAVAGMAVFSRCTIADGASTMLQLANPRSDVRAGSMRDDDERG